MRLALHVQHHDIYPQAQERPRFGRGGVRSPKTSWYHLVAWSARRVAPPAPLDGPLVLSVEYRFPRPRRTLAAQIYKWTKPDLDNLNKAVCDALTAAGWWADDARVVEEKTWKRYVLKDELPGAVIHVWNLERHDAYAIL